MKSTYGGGWGVLCLRPSCLGSRGHNSNDDDEDNNNIPSEFSVDTRICYVFLGLFPS